MNEECDKLLDEKEVKPNRFDVNDSCVDHDVADKTIKASIESSIDFKKELQLINDDEIHISVEEPIFPLTNDKLNVNGKIVDQDDPLD